MTTLANNCNPAERDPSSRQLTYILARPLFDNDMFFAVAQQVASSHTKIQYSCVESRLFAPLRVDSLDSTSINN
jgi:hypothetical protein